MLTAAKVATYRAFGGDADLWCRIGSVSQQPEMGDRDWDEITELLQRLHIVKSGIASVEFAEQTEELLRVRTESMAVVELLREYA